MTTSVAPLSEAGRSEAIAASRQGSQHPLAAAWSQSDSLYIAVRTGRFVINLRPATPQDLKLLRHWDEQPHVIASDPDDDWKWEVELLRDPDWREQLIAELDGRPIGFMQIIDPAREDSHYWGDISANLRAIDIWIGKASDLGQGHGTQMMRLALTRCFDDPAVTAVLLDPLVSNTRAHRFYERLGFRCCDRRQFGDDDCFVYQLSRIDWYSVTEK